MHRDDGGVLHLLGRVLQRHAALWAAGLPDMTKTQWAGLRAIAATPGRDQRTIGAGTGVDKATLTPLVARLAQRASISYDADPADRRRRLLVLTPAGREVVERMAPLVAAVDAATLAPLAEHERARLRELLARLA